MKTKFQMKCLISLILVLFTLIGLMPMNAVAAESGDPIIVIAGSDFQNSSGHTKTASLTAGILSQITGDYSHADGFLFAGDYDYNYNDSANGKAKLQETVLSAYPDLSTDAMVWVQGNHDSDSLVGSTLSSSGAHDAEGYGVYVINEKDYMWYNDDEATIRSTATKLETYLNTKRNAQYTSPIFVVSHLPLHYSMRTLKGGGDGKHANYIFDVLNEAGEAGLNIIFLFGHNHSHGWDDYLGGASIYLERGDKINIAQNSTTTYKEETLAFTYMNAGYVGYYGNTGNGSDQTLTMTTFAISGSNITIRRYDSSGYHTLKAAGVYGGEYPDNKYASPVYAADTSTVSTPHSMPLSLEVLPGGTDTQQPGTDAEGRTYTRITTASDLESGGKYLLIYNGSYFMLPQVVEKTNGSSYRKGFDLESTSACGDDTVTGDYQDKEWTLTSSGSGWLLGNGTQYAKLTNTSDMSVTATFEDAGDVFTVGGSENAFTFTAGSYVLNYNSRGLINGYASNPASFWLYRMTDEGNEGSEGGENGDNTSTSSVRQIQSYSELQENVGYLIVADEGEDITLTNQTNGSGLLLSGTVSADNEHLWYLDLTNEYIRYGSPSGSDNYLKVTNGGASIGSSSNRVTEILDNGDGTFSLYRSSYYMNRYGGSTSTKAAGYNQNNSGSRWKLYEIVQTHEYTTVTVPATCTADGSVTTRCTVCGEETVEVIPATGHAYDCVVTDATCTEDGSKVYTCAVCADTYTEVIPAAGSHSYTSEITEPTCIEAGSVVYTCEVCADTYTEVLAATGHSYEAEVTAATCTADGFTAYTCKTCGHSYRGETVPAFGHTYDSVVTATCTEDGFVVYTCETCGHSYTGEEVAAYGHSYETSTVAPTCTTSGYTTYVCKTCGYTCTGDETAALGHSYSAAVTEATCTEDGYTTYTCSACGHSYVGDHVAAPGHDYESVVTAPTYETEGYTTHTCKVCGDVKVDSYVPVLTHTYETVTVEATCTQDGSVIHTCIDCGYSYTEVLPALGHSWETVTVEAACTEDGSITTTCTVCGEQTVEVIPATGHSYEVTTVAPTCTENGYTAYTCGCGHVVTEEISATGHSYESVYTAPTCTENGNTAYTCGNCGDVYTEVIPALGHSYESVSVAPTCTEAGFTTYSCTVCGSSYTADETPALGHSYSGVVTAPTCTEAGYTTYTCSLCAHSYVGNSVAALGHSYECTETEGSLVYTCPVCGDSYTERLELTYTKVSAFKADHNYVITLVSGNKYYALSHENNTVSAVRVTVSDNQITSDITEDLLWTYSDGKLSYESGSTTYFLYAQPANNWWGGWWNWWTTPTLTLSTSSSSSVSLSSNKIKVDSYYLRYSSSAVSLNSSGTTAALFIEE